MYNTHLSYNWGGYKLWNRSGPKQFQDMRAEQLLQVRIQVKTCIWHKDTYFVRKIIMSISDVQERCKAQAANMLSFEAP